LKDREHFRRAYLEPLLAADWLEMTIPDKPRSSKQRYRTTVAGTRALDRREPR
jgi:ATP-dependent DNA helicase RecG